MAPLSVHRCSSGSASRRAARAQASLTARAARRYAPTPPATTRRSRPDLFERGDRPLTSTSTIAAWVDAARSALVHRQIVADFPAWVSTAVLRPANEKSRSPLCSSGAAANALGRPCRARSDSAQGRQDSPGRAVWPTVEGLAGGVVDGLAEQLVKRPTLSTRMSWVWPPETSSAMKGNRADRRSGRATADGRRWCTLSVGLFKGGSDRAGDAGADQQRAGQSRPRVGNQIDRVEPESGLRERGFGQQHAPDMVAAGELGHPRRRRPGASRSGCSAWPSRRGVAALLASTSATPVSSGGSDSQYQHAASVKRGGRPGLACLTRQFCRTRRESA